MVKKALRDGRVDHPAPLSSSESEIAAPTPREHAAPPAMPSPGEPTHESFYDQMFRETVELTGQERERPISVNIDDFKVEPRGTFWTWDHKEIASDAMKAWADSDDSKALCEHFLKQASVSYSTEDKFTLDEATHLCFMWADKMSYYLGIWRDNGRDPEFQWKREVVNGFRISEKHQAFVDHLRVGSKVPTRLQQYYRLVPKVVLES